MKKVDKEGKTPLHQAVQSKKNISAIKSETEKWPESLQIRDKEGCLPLHYASRFSDGEIVQFLFEKWPEAGEECDNKGCTPFAVACKAGNEKAAYHLTSKCPQACTKPDKDGHNPLHLVLTSPKPSVAIVRSLISKFPDSIGEKTKEGYTGLHLLIDKVEDEDSETEMLRARGEWEDPNEFSSMSAQKIDIAKDMAANCPDVASIAAANGTMPLHLAYKRDNKAIFRHLAEKVPNALKVPGSDGNTLLHEIAKGSEDSWTWAYFITDKCPETVTVKNKDGETPMEVAERLGHSKFRGRLSKKVASLC